MAKLENNFDLSNDSVAKSTYANETGIVSVFNYNDFSIGFENSVSNGIMINATQMAKPFGKSPKDFLKTEQTKRFISSLSEVKEILSSDLLRVIYGDNGGTWMQEDLALEFARWLSPKFSIWCNDRIKELLINGKTEIVRSTPKTYLEALKELVKSEEEKERIATELRLEQHRSNILEQNLEEAKPKAEYFDDLVDRKLNINIRNTAKEIHVKEKVFISSLIARGFLYRDAKNKLLPIAKYVDDLFVLKEYSNEKHSGVQVLITPKGRQTFKMIFGKGLV